MASEATEADQRVRPHFTESAGWKSWGAIASIFSLVSDLLKPLLPWLTLALLGVSVLVVLYAVIRNKHRGAVAYASVAMVVIGVIVVGQAFSANRVGPNPGIAGRLAPAITAAQAAVLPLSRTQSALLALGSDMRSSNISTREDAAEHALSLSDPAGRRTAMDALLTSGDPHLRALAMREAMKLKQGHALPIVVAQNAKQGPLSQGLSGAVAFIQTVDVTGSSFEGVFGNTTGREAIEGSVSSDGITMSSLIWLTKPTQQRYGVTFHFILTPDAELTGTAESSDGEIAPVSLPLL